MATPASARQYLCGSLGLLLARAAGTAALPCGPGPAVLPVRPRATQPTPYGAVLTAQSRSVVPPPLDENATDDAFAPRANHLDVGRAGRRHPLPADEQSLVAAHRLPPSTPGKLEYCRHSTNWGDRVRSNPGRRSCVHRRRRGAVEVTSTSLTDIYYDPYDAAINADPYPVPNWRRPRRCAAGRAGRSPSASG